MNLVFVSHDNSKTGAPILLLNLIKLLKKDHKITLVVVNWQDDGIQTDSRLDNVQIIKLENMGKTSLILRKLKILSLNFWYRYKLKATFKQADKIILNTITLGNFVRQHKLPNHKNKIFSYIHELEISTILNTKPEFAKLQMEASAGVFYICDKVKSFLNSEFNITKKMFPLSSYIETSKTIINTLNYNSQKLIVGGCGRPDWRKGIDLFVAIANDICKKYPEIDIEFWWKGFELGNDLEMFKYDLQKLGINEKVKYFLKDNQTEKFFSEIDLLSLTSRSDPYPMVVLEAALQGTPSLFFEESGGIGEFVNAEVGDSVGYLDVEAMVEKIVFYAKNKHILYEKGIKAQQKVLKLHCNKELILEQFNYAFNFK